jgi:hypothetical protein
MAKTRPGHEWLQNLWGLLFKAIWHSGCNHYSPKGVWVLEDD